jgi:hypothetical protein
LANAKKVTDDLTLKFDATEENPKKIADCAVCYATNRSTTTPLISADISVCKRTTVLSKRRAHS